MAKWRIEIIEDFCKGCEICVNICPITNLYKVGKVDKPVLRMSERFGYQGYPLVEVVDPSKCTGCRLCDHACPDLAIHVIKEED
jgi:NAD-dependent dihydropyrimidine dehydrogenase PreA subunit